MTSIRILGAAVVAAGCAVAATVGLAADSAGAAPAACTATSLKPVFEGNNGTPGHFNDMWFLINVGTSTCTIKGYPSIVNYRQDGRPMHTSVSHRWADPTVTLAHGEHAKTVLSYVDPRVSDCTAEPAAGMTIRWNGTTYPVIALRGVRSCNGVLTATGFLHGGT